MESNSAVTLTQVAYFGRLFVKFGIISLVLLIVGRIFLTASINYWVATHPAPPPPPTVGFGVLPALHFPVRSDAQKPKSYRLETATGELPYFGDRAKVFFMPKSVPNLLADQRANEVAANYDFRFTPTVLDSRTYRWSKTTPLQATLDMDIQNLNFTLTTNYLSQPQLLVNKNLPTDDDAISLAKSYVAYGQDLPSDLATASGQVTYLKALGGEITPAVSYSDADFIQVDVLRNPVDHVFFYTPEGTKGLIHAVITGSLQGKDQVVEMEYRYHPIDYTEVNTYPLRSVQTAWQVLQAGQGFIANKGTSDQAVVRDVNLGYYDDFDEQEYMQPIYVFSGDNGFLGYVPAIDPQFSQGAAQNQNTPAAQHSWSWQSTWGQETILCTRFGRWIQAKHDHLCQHQLALELLLVRPALPTLGLPGCPCLT